ncbi:nuclear protein 2 [Suncus etruscus]|uniref:nuclear protein 2 n=1 Tax=Suncus etruscus TaxID=109475 RepID=UPI00210F71C2|nr:nuclear protein 2 [Suncus etruscus]
MSPCPAPPKEPARPGPARPAARGALAAALLPRAMEPVLLCSRSGSQQAFPEMWPASSPEEELYDCPDEHYLRDFPACGAGRSKGRTRREREQRANWTVPGGHERKVAQKLVNSQRKRRQRQLQPRPRTRLAERWCVCSAGQSGALDTAEQSCTPHGLG